MRKILLLSTFFTVLFIQAQEHAWVYFVDKPNEAVFMAAPLTMLTQRSLDRRTVQNIALDFKDVPIATMYVNQINAINGIEVKAKSKWLNAVHVIGSEAAINDLETLAIVDYVEFAAKALNNKNKNSKNKKSKFGELENYNYGNSLNQAQQIGVDFLHQNNYTGSGMQIAILDAGFPNVDNFSAFQKIRDNNQILGGYNFVDSDANFYQYNNHGTSVLSTIAGFVDGELVGTAPDASFYLFITEDVSSETPLEESLWVEAAEKADSLGVNIINSSLSYRDFDEPKYNHSYADMDGKTTFISRGANVAATRGMLVVISAGNSGDSATYNYIGTPADATNVFTIGAVNAVGTIASFSSYGPAFGGKIKPDVLAKGARATVINSVGNVSVASGTSFSSPVMAGAIASLWQAFPYKTNFEIMQLIRESAHLFTTPTAQEGFGIPNLKRAFENATYGNFSLDNMIVYPNPFTDKIYYNVHSDVNSITISAFDLLGRKVLQEHKNFNTPIDFSKFQSGVYMLRFETLKGKTKIVKLIKR